MFYRKNVGHSKPLSIISAVVNGNVSKTTTYQLHKWLIETYNTLISIGSSCCDILIGFQIDSDVIFWHNGIGIKSHRLLFGGCNITKLHEIDACRSTQRTATCKLLLELDCPDKFRATHTQNANCLIWWILGGCWRSRWYSSAVFDEKRWTGDSFQNTTRRKGTIDSTEWCTWYVLSCFIHPKGYFSEEDF